MSSCPNRSTAVSTSLPGALEVGDVLSVGDRVAPEILDLGYDVVRRRCVGSDAIE